MGGALALRSDASELSRLLERCRNPSVLSATLASEAARFALTVALEASRRHSDSSRPRSFTSRRSDSFSAMAALPLAASASWTASRSDCSRAWAPRRLISACSALSRVPLAASSDCSCSTCPASSRHCDSRSESRVRSCCSALRRASTSLSFSPSAAFSFHLASCSFASQSSRSRAVAVASSRNRRASCSASPTPSLLCCRAAASRAPAAAASASASSNRMFRLSSSARSSDSVCMVSVRADCSSFASSASFVS
mmetsp:Transcript_37010/g.87955  ORF Transcript_37010/g.87955 Transcript_37010/m.87955 type:complete len:254 (+) Transcript_37010:930-1691(+)